MIARQYFFFPKQQPYFLLRNCPALGEFFGQLSIKACASLQPGAGPGPKEGGRTLPDPCRVTQGKALAELTHSIVCGHAECVCVKAVCVCVSAAGQQACSVCARVCVCLRARAAGQRACSVCACVCAAGQQAERVPAAGSRVCILDPDLLFPSLAFQALERPRSDPTGLQATPLWLKSAGFDSHCL